MGQPGAISSAVIKTPPSVGRVSLWTPPPIGGLCRGVPRVARARGGRACHRSTERRSIRTRLSRRSCSGPSRRPA